MAGMKIYIDFLKKLYKSRYTIQMMALRDLKAQYVGSALGFLWAVINPLFQVALYSIVFGLVLKQKPDPVYGTDLFFLYLLCGLMPWLFFSQATTMSINVVTENRTLIKKSVGFAPEILPIITVTSNIISHLIGMSVLFVVLLVDSASSAPCKVKFGVPRNR